MGWSEGRDGVRKEKGTGIGDCRRRRTQTHLDTVPLLLPLVHLIFHLDDLQLQLLLLQRQLGLWGGEERKEREPGELGLRVAQFRQILPCCAGNSSGELQAAVGTTCCQRAPSQQIQLPQQSTHLPGCQGAALNHMGVMSCRGKGAVSKFSCVCRAGPSPGCACAAITVFM